MAKVQIECIVFRKKGRNYEFLLLKRTSEKGGFWQPPCGGMEEKDRSRLAAAYRELLEEANIPQNKLLRVIEEAYYFEIDRHYLTDEKIAPIKEYVYGFEVDPKTEISISKNPSKEHEEFKWVSFEEALRLLKWEDNKNAFNRLKSLINSKAL